MCTAAAANAGAEMELAFTFDAKVGDGRFANLGWLARTPRRRDEGHVGQRAAHVACNRALGSASSKCCATWRR
jgi:hypothetical protein